MRGKRGATMQDAGKECRPPGKETYGKHRASSESLSRLVRHDLAKAIVPLRSRRDTELIIILSVVFLLHKINRSRFRPYLDALKIPKLYKILHHIESLNVCMEY